MNLLIIDNEFVRNKTKLIRHLIKKRLGSTSLEEQDTLVTDVIVNCILNSKYYNPRWDINTFIGLQVRTAVADFMALTYKAGVFTVQLEAHHDAEAEEYNEHPDFEDMSYLQHKLQPYMHILSNNEYKVIKYHCWDRLSVNEIAGHMGLHAASISSIKTRAKDKLIQYIGRDGSIGNTEVDIDTPLEHAIKQLPLAEYHAYRLSVLRGKSPHETANIMGISATEVTCLVTSAMHEINYRWGFRA